VKQLDKKNNKPEANNRKKPLNKGLLFAGFCLVALVSFIAGTRQYEIQSYIHGILSTSNSRYDHLNVSSIQETYNVLKANFDGKLDTQKLIEGANRGLVEAAGDDFTTYLTTQQAKELEDDLNGEYGSGIGAQIATRNNLPTIVRVLPNNAAQRAGLQNGDQIIQINDEDVTKLPLDQVVAKILGEAGTTVKIEIMREGNRKQFSIKREKIDNPSVYSQVQDGIGILTISRFDNETGVLARAEAKKLVSKHIKGLILDLRGDGGGYLTGAVDVASLWLDDKVVVTQRHNGKVVETHKSKGDPILKNTKTVILVDQGTASASEILAGALRYYDKASLVGETTYGKGSVQGVFDLSYGGKLKVTLAHWYTPAGVNLSGNGLKPDSVVKLSPADLNKGIDPQLNTAKDILLK
jgi:carboxyl-terminal processing protease